MLIEQTAPTLPVGDPVCRIAFNNATTGGYGLLVQLEGVATTGTVSVQQCLLRDNRVANLMARSADSADLTVTVNGSNVNRSGTGIATPGGDGIVLANFDSAGITAAITNNTISNNARSGIRMGEATALAASLLRATITGNSFVSPLTATDATIAGRFISNSQARLLIADNGAATEGQPERFEQLGSLPGILIDTSVGTPNVSVTLTNNHVDLNDTVNPLNTPGTRGNFGIDLQARTGTVCAAVGGATGGNASHWFPIPVASNSTGTVLTAPVPADTGTTVTLTLPAGSDMPSIFPFYAIVGDSEVVEVTGRIGDTLTMVRAQENTTARTIVAGDEFRAIGGRIRVEQSGTAILSLEQGGQPLATPASTVLQANNTSHPVASSQTVALGTIGVVANGSCVLPAVSLSEQ